MFQFHNCPAFKLFPKFQINAKIFYFKALKNKKWKFKKSLHNILYQLEIYLYKKIELNQTKSFPYLVNLHENLILSYKIRFLRTSQNCYKKKSFNHWAIINSHLERRYIHRRKTYVKAKEIYFCLDFPEPLINHSYLSHSYQFDHNTTAIILTYFCALGNNFVVFLNL